MAPSWPHYVDSKSARNAKELGGEGSSLCGVLLPAWDSQVLLFSSLILEEVVKHSAALMPAG